MAASALVMAWFLALNDMAAHLPWPCSCSAHCRAKPRSVESVSCVPFARVIVRSPMSGVFIPIASISRISDIRCGARPRGGGLDWSGEAPAAGQYSAGDVATFDAGVVDRGIAAVGLDVGVHLCHGL